MIRIAVCEDEPVLLEWMTGLISTILDKNQIIYCVEAFENGTALLSREPFDILLLDIAMKPYNGIELARRLRYRQVPSLRMHC